jgi:Ras and EF-hand domain-containing protein
MPEISDVLFYRFRSITKQYFRKADGVVLLYDLTSESSFINIKSWMTSVEVGTKDIYIECPENTQIIIGGYQ